MPRRGSSLSRWTSCAESSARPSSRQTALRSGSWLASRPETRAIRAWLRRSYRPAARPSPTFITAARRSICSPMGVAGCDSAAKSRRCAPGTASSYHRASRTNCGHTTKSRWYSSVAARRLIRMRTRSCSKTDSWDESPPTALVVIPARWPSRERGLSRTLTRMCFREKEERRAANARSVLRSSGECHAELWFPNQPVEGQKTADSRLRRAVLQPRQRTA